LRSDGLIVDPVEDGMVSLLFLPLGSHMSSTVNGDEGEPASTLLDVTGNLLTIHVGNVVRSPFLNYGPAHICNPVLSTKSGDGTIGISGVLEDLVFVEEHGVDPVCGILKGSVIDSVAAEVPHRRRILDVQLLSHYGVVEVIEDGATGNAGRNFLQTLALSIQEGGVHLGGELAVAPVALAENIIDIDKSGLVLELVIDLLANS